MNNKTEKPGFTDYDEENAGEEEIFQPPAEPETPGETARKTGLALSAGITLFGSVVVLMTIGYLADRFFNSSPTGLIIGIVLGAIIGFYQFFRLTSQILKK
ncbi:MAG TPA: AtpZ/AtpI family protein [Pyrinomonadaceae bacterium]|jgi:F0F1-type ATP synthase assembly protein I